MPKATETSQLWWSPTGFRSVTTDITFKVPKHGTRKLSRVHQARMGMSYSSRLGRNRGWDSAHEQVSSWSPGFPSSGGEGKPRADWHVHPEALPNKLLEAVLCEGRLLCCRFDSFRGVCKWAVCAPQLAPVSRVFDSPACSRE